MIDGTTLLAGGPAIVISSTTLSLVSETAGLYLTEVGTASSAFSMPVTAEASMTMDAARKLVEAESSDILNGEVEGSGLDSLITLGMRQGSATSASSFEDNASDSIATSMASLVAFMRTANRALDPSALISVSLALFVGGLAVL